MYSRSIKENYERTNGPRKESQFIYKKIDDRIDTWTDNLIGGQSDRWSDRYLDDQKDFQSIKKTKEGTNEPCNESPNDVRISREAYGLLRAYESY